MPKLRPIQYDFSAGELSPLLKAAVDTDWYQRGLAYSENVALQAQGPFVSREGLEFWKEVIGTSGRVFNFQRSAEESYIVVISNSDQLYVLNVSGSPVARQLLQNSDFDLGLDYWTPITPGNTSATVTDGILSLQSHNNNEVYVFQSVTDVYENVLHNVSVSMPENDGNIINIKIGISPNTDNYLNLSGGGTELNGQFTPNQASPYYVTIQKDAGSNTTKRVESIRLIVETTSTIVYQTTTPWDNNALYALHANMPPELDQMFITQPQTPPYILAVDPSETWNLLQITFTPSEPTFWTDKANNYPRTVAFFQGRAWYGGGGERFIGSRSRDANGSPRYGDITVGTQADDAIDYRIDERGDIKWMVGLENLVIGTTTGEHIVTSEGGVIIPGDIDVIQQSAYGSNFCQPLKMGTKVLYVSANGERIYEIGYRWREEKWVSRDIFFSAEHLSKGVVIKELVSLTYPNSLIGAVFTSGVSALCLYDEVREKIGWTRLSTKGNIVSNTVTRINGDNHLVALISRDRYSGFDSLLNIEITSKEKFEVMDSIGSEFSSLAKNTIDEAQHLAYETVQVIVDGARHPDVLIAADGTAALQWSGNYIVYGLPVTVKVQLLDQGSLVDGSTLHMKQRWNKLFLRLHQSVLPIITSQGSKLPIRLPDRDPSTPMGTAEDLHTGDIQITELGFKSGGIIIESDEPFPLQVIGVFGELQADQLG